MFIAADTNMETIKTAMSSAFSDVSSNVSSMIATSVPYALAVVGLVLATTIGIKTFKKIAGQA
jgi:hypothetical protein